MAFWSRRASRANALQQAFNVAYAASLQSVLLESNQELPAALDAYKATLMGIETALATIDLNAVQYGQEKSLLASINDIKKQCTERIAYIERKLDSPELINHPYGMPAPTSNGTGSNRGHRASPSIDNSLSTAASTSRSSVNRVAVGSRASPSVTVLPPKGGASSAKPTTAPPPVPVHRTKQPQPQPHLPALKPSDDLWSGFDWSPANSASDVLIPSIPPAPPVKPSHPAPPLPAHSAPQIPTVAPQSASTSAAALASQASATQGSDAKVTRARPSAPTPAKSNVSLKSTKDMFSDKKYQMREPRRSGERPHGPSHTPQAPPSNRTPSGGSQHEASRSAPLLASTLAALTSSPAGAAGGQATSSSTPAAIAPARRTNRYVVTKSGSSVVSQRSGGHSATEAAKNAALITASRRAKTNVAASGMSSVLTSTAAAAQKRRQNPGPATLSVSTQSSQATGSAPHSAVSTPVGALLPAFDQISLNSPESVDSIDSEDEWDAMAREKIKGLRGVDQAAAENILNEIVLKGDPVHWDDIAGLERAKASLKETVVYPFLRPDLFSGLREPALGMLLFGPPGTGKTMLARAVATESKSTFFSISASSLTSKYMGESEKLVRALFQLAKALAPSIIFVDEIDSILTQRRDSGEHEASRRIKNEFLVHWSDLQSAAAGRQTEDANVRRVLVLGATNLPWAIDEAARRRFVRRQYIPLPEIETRNAHIRKLLSHQKHMLTDEDIAELVAKTDGYSGSDLTALAKDAALGPLRELGDKLLTTAPDQIRPIGINDFVLSMQTIRASVGPDSLKVFEDWAKLYGSSGA